MQTHDTGKLMKQIYACMNTDSANATGLVEYPEQVSNLFQGKHAQFRGYTYPSRCQAPPYIFKWSYQLESLCKRFRFEQDAFTDAELEEKLFTSFNNTQLRLPSALDNSAVVRRVLSEARVLLRGILGPFDPEEYQKFCRFGKNAAVGVTKKDGLAHLRLKRPLSGSPRHLELFSKEFLESDPLLKETICKCQINGIAYNPCRDLKLSCVPKSFKALRGIMPNTEVGNFLTSGLSKYLESRLYLCGIDLSKAAERHKRLAKIYSSTRSHVTADLSAASDSFTTCLINALVPRDWFNALKYGRISHYTWGGKRYYMQSFMTMGIGFTFPLQTLLFYALIRSIGKLLGKSGVYSVFGDDLIYPRCIHRIVVHVLGKLGFLLNIDKTFVKDYFRESCGGDFYRGVDVRPFQPEGQASMVTELDYCMFIYKVVNGLRRRWSEEEIPLTLEMLRQELLRLGCKVLQVPPSFPEESGWRVDAPIHDDSWERVRVWHSCRFLKRLKALEGFTSMPRDNDNVVFSFYFLKRNATSVPVTCQYPYYWEVLRKGSTIGFAPRSSVIWRTVRQTRGKKRLRPFVKGQLDSVTQVMTTQTSIWD